MFVQWIKRLGTIALILSISLTGVSAVLAQPPGQPALAVTDYTVTSPDGSISAIVSHDTANGTLTYRAARSGAAVIDQSALGINTSLGDFSSGLSFLGRVDNVVNETYTMPGHKKATYVNHASEMVLRFSKGGQEMDLAMRAYDDGVAFQYRLPGSGSVSISSENSHFNFPDTVDGWAMNPTADYQNDWTYRSSFNSGSFSMGTLVRLSNTWALLAESDVYNYTDSNFSAASGADFRYAWNTGLAISGTRPFNTAWRLAEIGSLDTIFQSTMIENLGGTSQIADTSWIQPGISSWSWWSGDSTTDLNVAKSYVDFSASMGWKFYLADDGWKQGTWMPDLISYANSKGVGIIIWVNSDEVDTEAKADALFSQWAQWGAAGVKVDYIWDGGQAKMQEYDMIARVAAENHLVLNFHGAKQPDGLERRWPNLLTRESIFGAEQYKGNTTSGPTARFNTVIPFTRNAVGPMDYTPVTYSDNNNMTTWGHQTALAVLYTSYTQHFADKPSIYNASVAKPFLQTVPAVWDESRLLEGLPDQYVTVARRSGNDWYVGSIVGNNQSRTVSLPLTFLNSGTTYTAQIYKDGSSDTQIVYQQQTVTSADTLSIPERVNGGFAIRFVSGTLPTQTPSPTPTPLPSPWQHADIGSVSVAGSATYSGGTFTVKGGGADIWDTADAFHYVYQSLNGDGTVTARVASLSNTNSWAKAGVMIRETLNADSTHAMVVITPSNGLAFQWRASTGGTSLHTGGAAVTAPYWVRLTRSGNTFTGYSSPDGSTWTQVGSATIGMAGTVYVGLPVTAHDNTTTATATFDNVSVTGGVGPTATPTRTNTPPPTGTNLALNKTATGSASCNSSETPPKAVNGSWTGGNSDKWCDSTSASKWWQVDLGQTYSVNQFVIRHAGAGGESTTYNTRDFNLQVSTNGTSWTTVVTVTGNSSNVTTHNIAATSARYVRLNVTAGTQGTSTTARIYEVEVYGASSPTPTPTNTPPPVSNLALNKPATASASCNANEGPEKAVNGSWTGGNSDKWCDNTSASKWWQVDLGGNFNVNQFVVRHAGAGGESTTWNTRDFTIQVSTDGVNWTTVVTVTANTASTTTHNITTTTARYVRLNVTAGEQSGSTARIYEVEVYGN